MSSMARLVSSLFMRPSVELNSVSSQLQQWRGIRVRVFNNLERALMLMQRQMQSSGIERLIKNDQPYHIKNSEKRVLARKKLQRKIGSQELARKLKSILIKKVSNDIGNNTTLELSKSAPTQHTQHTVHRVTSGSHFQPGVYSHKTLMNLLCATDGHSLGKQHPERLLRRFRVYYLYGTKT